MRLYDRDGRALTLDEWVALLERGDDYRKVASDAVTDGLSTWWVSTIWLGVDHSWGQGAPLIFETMVFTTGSDNRPDDWGAEWADRYTSEHDALLAHQVVVRTLAEQGLAGLERYARARRG